MGVASKKSVTMLLTKTTAAQNEDALSYYKVRGLYFLAVVFVRTIILVVPSARVTQIMAFRRFLVLIS